MLYESKTFRLKDGRQAVLRVPEPDDAAAMIRYLTDTSAETEFLLRYPEECAWTLEEERGLLESFKSADNSLMLCCFVEGELAGNCNIQFNRQLKFRHKASVAIALYRKFWSLGIGTAMMEAMISVARERDVEQLELDYIEGNDRGRALYEKMGFVEVAEHPNGVKLKSGDYRKLISMVKKL